MQPALAILCFISLICFLSSTVTAQDFASVAQRYRPRLESNLVQNIVGFWNPKTLDRTNGGYTLNHDLQGRLKGPGTKAAVTQARMVWFYSRLARAGYNPTENLAAAELGYRFLTEKMRDEKNGGYFWEVTATGDRPLRPKKHLYAQSFVLYALSEYYVASGKPAALERARQLFDLMEAKAHDARYGGYRECFNEDWTPLPPGENSYMGEPDYKLMNTHLHLLEAMTTFYRASRLPLARERLLELITIESSTVVRKGLGACTDKYQQDWTPLLTGNYARVSYGHDLENIWLLMDACDAAGVPNQPLLDLYRALFDYSLKHGYDAGQGGFYNFGSFNEPASNREKVWWTQAEAIVAALYMHRATKDPKYLEVFSKTYDWIEQRQVDWVNGEWFDTITPQGTPRGDKAQPWKAGYHNGRAMIECLEMFNAVAKTEAR